MIAFQRTLYKVKRLCAVSCAKTAEPIERQFGILSQVGQGNMYYMVVAAPTIMDTFGVSGRLIKRL